MSPVKLASTSVNSFKEASIIVGEGLRTIKRDPQIMLYPYLAVLVILITFPFANQIVHDTWNKLFNYYSLGIADEAPHRVRTLLGLVTFYFYYTSLITSYFTIAIAASVLKKLEDKPTTPLFGLKIIFKHFPKVSLFAALSILLFPLSIIAQRKKLKSPKKIVEVVGSSFSLQTAQLAPAILYKKMNVFQTIRNSVETLGKSWKANLVIKMMTYLTVVILAFMSFLPKAVEHYWFDDNTSHIIGWIATIFLGIVSYVVIKVIGTVFTTTTYYKAANKK
jgi:hypothetical protein